MLRTFHVLAKKKLRLGLMKHVTHVKLLLGVGTSVYLGNSLSPRLSLRMKIKL